jgi:hypothetical protein
MFLLGNFHWTARTVLRHKSEPHFSGMLNHAGERSLRCVVTGAVTPEYTHKPVGVGTYSRKFDVIRIDAQEAHSSSA